MIVVDTGGIVALLDADDQHHAAVRQWLDERGTQWILPWAILPEVDHIARRRLGDHVARAFVEDVRDGTFAVDAHVPKDLPRACELTARYGDLALGLVDAVVMAQAERHRAEVIITTDARHFRAVKLAAKVRPRLVPLDG